MILKKLLEKKLQLAAAAMIFFALVFSAIMLSEGFRFAPVELDFWISASLELNSYYFSLATALLLVFM